MAQGEGARLALVSQAQGSDARPEPPHGLRGSALPEHRRMLDPRHGHVHDSRRRLHTRLRLLRGGTRPPGVPIDAAEPARVAAAVQTLDLAHVVVTSVDRDDVADGGAAIFADTIREIRKRTPSASIEVLIPDFQGKEASLHAVLDAGPDILNHNTETVPRLYRLARSGGRYSAHARAAGSVATLRAAYPHEVWHHAGSWRRVGRDRRHARAI